MSTTINNSFQDEKAALISQMSKINERENCLRSRESKY